MEHISADKNSPRVSIIIPSRDGYRDGCVPRLLESVQSQTFRDYELHIIKAVFPQGKSINIGAEKATGEILVILDDDSRLADETVLEKLITVIDSDSKIGMAGASIVLPPEASEFQRKAALQFPRFNTPVVDEVTDSDYACHGCCAIPAKIFHEIGGERDNIIRGLDPDLRVRLREAGYRVVLVPHSRIYHPLPDGWGPLVKIFFRNGFGSAYSRKYDPDTVYETHEGNADKDFNPKNSFPFRVFRFPVRLIKALLQLKFMRFAAYCSYACGYCWGTLTAKEKSF